MPMLGLALAAATLISGVSLPHAAAPTPTATALTHRATFDWHIATLKRSKGVDAHIALSEAQRLATSVPGGWAELAPVAESIAKRTRVPWLAGEAMGTLAAASHVVSPSKARAALGEAGVLMNGAVFGPLTGLSSEPPLAYSATETRRGVVDDVTWRPFADAALTGPLQLDDLIDHHADAHAYVRFALEVPKPVDVMIVAGTNGSNAAWLDGKELFSWEGERQLTDWQHAVPVRLNKGIHHLQVRVGHATQAPATIVRIIDKRGLAPKGLVVRAPRERDTLATFTPSKRLPKALGEMAKTPRQLGLLRLYVDAEPATARRAANALEIATQEDPDDARLWTALARAEVADKSRALAAFERAASLGDAEAMAGLVDSHAAQGLVAGADSWARRLASADPTHPAAIAHDASKVMAVGDAQAALARLERALAKRSKRGAEHSGRLLALRASLLEAVGQLEAATDAWAEVLALAGGSLEPLRRAVNLARRRGEIDAAATVVGDALSRRPYASTPHLLAARALALRSETRAAALEAVASGLAFHPDSPELHETRGRILLLDGNQSAAVAAFDRALELAPQNRGLADYRRQLTSSDTLASLWATPLDAVVDAAPPVPESAAAGAEVLLERTVVKVHPSGLSSQFRQQVVRIVDDSATERYTQMVFPFTPGEDRVELVEAEVVHPDGTKSRPSQVFDHRPSGKQMGIYTLRALRVVRFASVAPGDIVHVQTRTDEVGQRNIFGDFFGVLLPVQSDVLKHRLEVVVEAPASRPLYHHSERMPKPAITRSDDGTLQRFTWTVDGMTPISVEPQMPGYGDVGAYVNVSTFSNWESLAAWYRTLVRPQLELSSELRSTARDLVRGLKTTREKVAAVHEWVVKTTRYVGIEFGIHGFKPYRVTDIAKRGYGDCKDKASLFISMLEEVGVDADLVLVRTRDNGAISEAPATLWAFNHAISYVPELDTYLDGTAEYSGLGELPKLDQGAVVLRIRVNDDSPPVLTRIPVSTPAENAVVSSTAYTVVANGDAVMDLKETIAGTTASRMRAMFQDVSRRDELLGSILARQHAGASVVRASYAHLDDLGVPVTIDVQAKLPGLARVEGQRLDVPISLSPNDMLERYGRLATRQQTLVLDSPEHERETLTVSLPLGSVVITPAQKLSETSRFGSYQLELTPIDAGFEVKRELIVETTRIAPNDYPAFRKFLETVAKHEGMRVQVELGQR